MGSVQDPEMAGISVGALTNAKGISPSMLEAINKCDKDRNGVISPEELLNIIQGEKEAVQTSRLLKKVIIILVVLLFLTIAAVAGVTYGIV